MADNLLIPNVGPIQPRTDIGDRQTLDKSKGPAFDSVLKGKLSDAPGKPNAAAPEAAGSSRFGAHALSRIQERSIPMGGEMLAKLEKAVETAAQKGAKESLVLTNDAAFIVSVKNKTVITVVDRNQMNGNVFTNIDSTVVI